MDTLIAMRSIVRYTGLVVPLDHLNVDTDSIIPKQYLKSIKRTGYGATLFDSWRYLDAGELGQDHSERRLNPDFVLNRPRYKGGSILLARDNFGCGSSREHAVWALIEYGFRVVVTPRFADIFYHNSIKNGLLPVTLTAAEVDVLFERCCSRSGYALTVDLEKQSVGDDDDNWHFEMDRGHKNRLMKGLDEIALTLQHADRIRAYEERRLKEAPWLFADHGEPGDG